MRICISIFGNFVKIRYFYDLVQNFQFRKFLLMNSNNLPYIITFLLDLKGLNCYD